MNYPIYTKANPVFDDLWGQYANIFAFDEPSIIIDARTMACPMPLLTLKIALKNTQNHNGIYLIASDKNSTQDIKYFCEKQNLGVCIVTDTFFHFYITKNCSKNSVIWLQ